jgi:hypothetical protein
MGHERPTVAFALSENAKILEDVSAGFGIIRVDRSALYLQRFALRKRIQPFLMIVLDYPTPGHTVRCCESTS